MSRRSGDAVMAPGHAANLFPTRDPASSGSQHDFAGDPPGLSWLIARLTPLKDNPELVRRHALNIMGAVGSIRGRGDRYGYLFNPGSKGPRVPRYTRGTARELEELRRAARRAIKQNDVKLWLEAWAAVPHRTRVLVWAPPAPPVIERRRDATGRLIGFRRASIDDTFKDVFTIFGPGFTMIAPHPRNGLPLIEQATQRLKATPANVRRKRTSDVLDADLGRAIKTAWVELTGKLPKPVLWINPKLDSPLIALARDIDARFALHVFTAHDSPRLRALFN
jgi:hypothetical protein